MAVHRISDRAEHLLGLLAKEEGKTPAQFLHDLIVNYAQGQSFTPLDQRSEETSA